MVKIFRHLIYSFVMTFFVVFLETTFETLGLLRFLKPDEAQRVMVPGWSVLTAWLLMNALPFLLKPWKGQPKKIFLTGLVLGPSIYLIEMALSLLQTDSPVMMIAVTALCWALVVTLAVKLHHWMVHGGSIAVEHAAEHSQD